jgi:hypothetical protein
MCEEWRFGKPRVGKGNRQRIQGSYVVAVVAANKAIMPNIFHPSVSKGKDRFP